MKVDQKQDQVDALFAQAVELAPDARAAFLKRECGDVDAEVRARVEQLLAADETIAKERLFKPLAGIFELDAPSDAAQPFEPETEVIGPYRLLERLGDGGMGVVYMAEQSHPVRRRVALKVIKPGMDSKLVCARFEAERQALAMMDHPNIARVFDVGTTEQGRPYFVMELVKGRPITEYCDKKKLPVRARLQLFLSVCHALQHAHQKGVIHRDIKPSNVMVAEYDGKPVVKVIDFGLAKALRETLTEKTLFTQFGQVVGTYEYMSPEQANFNQLDVDTRTDIYSLGVLLYELLTGRPPFESEILRSAAFDEMLRIIREELPVRPSLKLSSTKESQGTADNRKSDPGQLTALVKGDLDAIVMKSLEKERNHRYETSGAFAEDVQRYLDDEPILASPPSPLRYWRSMIRRHRKIAAAAATLFALLLCTSGAATVAWTQARQQLLEQHRHATSIALTNRVYSAWEQGNLTRAGELLSQSQPAARRDLEDSFEWGYLKRLIRDSQPELQVHNPSLRGIVFDKNDRLLTVCPGELGEPLTNQKHSLPSDFKNESNVDLSTDGRFLVYIRKPKDASDAVKMVLWDVVNQHELDAIECEPHLRAVPREVENPLPVQVRFSRDARWIATSTWNESFLLLWRVTEAQQLQFDKVLLAPPLDTISGDGPWWVRSIEFDRGGNLVAAGTRDGTTRVWRVKDGELYCTLAHNGPINSIAFAANGSYLATIAKDGPLRLWDLKTQTCQREIHSEHVVTSICLSSDDTHVVTGSQSGIVRYVRLDNPSQARSFRGTLGKIDKVEISSTGDRIAAHDNKGSVNVWSINSGKGDDVGLRRTSARDVVRFHKDDVCFVAFHPTKNLLASADLQGNIALMDTSTSQIIKTHKHHDRIWHVDFLPDGERLSFVTPGSTQTQEKSSYVWDFNNDTVVNTGMTAWSVTYHPRLKLGCRVNYVEAAIFDRDTHEDRFRISGPEYSIPFHYQSIAFADEGSIVTIAGNGGWFGAWDVEKQERLWLVNQGDSRLICKSAISPDGQQVATTTSNGDCIIRSLADGQQLCVFTGHSGRTRGIVFFPDGKTMASASEDDTVKLWDRETGEERFTFHGDGAGFKHLALAPDGKTLAACDGNGAIWLWRTLDSNTDGLGP